MRINKSYQRIESQDCVTDPKTEKSNRIVSLTEFLSDEVQDFISSLYGIKKNERIFQITKHALHKAMEAGCEKSGVKKIRLHDTRQQVFDYIENPDKTEESVYVSSYLCDYKTVVEDFREIQRLAMKKGNNLAHHLIQSFSTEDNITPEKALEIGEEFMRRLFPDFQCVIAVHIQPQR